MTALALRCTCIRPCDESHNARQTGGPTGRWRVTSTTPPPPSIDHAPSPTLRIALTLGKNIEQQSYDGSPENQGAVAPRSPSIPHKPNCPKVARIAHCGDLVHQRGEMSLHRQNHRNLYCTKYKFNWHANQSGRYICAFMFIINLNTSRES